jgi:hypothetical protein
MHALASILLALAALIIFGLGALHLLLTFRGNKLHPRDAALEARLKEVSPILTRETTMWKAWIGFNASHSYGALLFGAVYGYLAIFRSEVLLQDRFLLGTGLVLLSGYVFLGKRYWFRVPFRAILAAAVLYIAALVANAI